MCKRRETYLKRHNNFAKRNILSVQTYTAINSAYLESDMRGNLAPIGGSHGQHTNDEVDRVSDKTKLQYQISP